MLTVTSLKASYGDCFVVRWGDARQPYVMVIDGGVKKTHEQLLAHLAGTQVIDLMVVTHVDYDHIGGILALLTSKDFVIPICDFWFNAPPSLHPSWTPEGAAFDVGHGDELTDAIKARRLRWNAAFGGKSVQVDGDVLPVVWLPGDMKLTLLSPDKQSLDTFLKTWPVEIAQFESEFRDPDFGAFAPPECLDGTVDPDLADLADSKFVKDSSLPNRSSIAFLLEYLGKSALFTGDAHADVVLNSLNKLNDHSPIQIDLLKFSHHGSSGTSNRALLDKVWANEYLISTDGSKYGHPHGEPIALVLTSDVPNPCLTFNYRSRCNSVWDKDSVKMNRYSTSYAESGDDGVVVTLIP